MLFQSISIHIAEHTFFYSHVEDTEELVNVNRRQVAQYYLYQAKV